LRRNRDCILDYRCVYRQLGDSIQFLEASSLGSSHAEYSTILGYESNDQLFPSRNAAPLTYNVDCISLEQLLDSQSAPSVINFLSIDTEGSEYDILRDFDYGKKYTINSICVEHNNVPDKRERISQLMKEWGLIRVLQHLSRWDDWYVDPDHW
jgi:FkbM family methyltransferase